MAGYRASMSKGFGNRRKQRFLGNLPTEGLLESDIATRASISFAFLDSRQPAGQGFADWDRAGGALRALRLLEKLQAFTSRSLDDWRAEGTLRLYGDFPGDKSDFNHPAQVPHDVCWGRFRLSNKARLVGFVIPEPLHDHEIHHNGRPWRLNRNIFYAVFLDGEHRFYKTEPA